MDSKKDIDISYIADLAKIELSDVEKEKFSTQLGQILEYFNKLSKVDVSNVEPSAHGNPIYNVWRDDDPDTPLSVEQALMNAPAKRENQLVVPKVVDDA